MSIARLDFLDREAALYKNARNKVEETSDFIQNQIDSLDLNQGNKTFVSFEIAKDGSIQNAKVLVGENENFNKAVVDLVTKSPKWKPATKNNEAVKSSYLFEASN